MVFKEFKQLGLFLNVTFVCLLFLSLQITGYLVILYFELGVAALIGSLIFFITIPIQVVIARKTAKYQKISMVRYNPAPLHLYILTYGLQ